MTWEALTPTSFQTTLYLPSLKISITAGSFITYRKGETGLLVGRVVEVVSSINLIPQDDNYPLID
jgi:ABC-type microcin C transport system permease subunit YejE